MTCKVLGEYFGGISGAGITMKYNQMKETLDQDKKLNKKIMKIRRKLNI
jgi:hypothetical protein